MALVATPGASNANSFLTVARADTIASERPHSSVWSALSGDSAKEPYLITATRILNSRLCVLGLPTSASQALLFPRNGLLNRNGQPLDDSTIPLDIELATFELALMLIPSDVTLESEASVQGLTRLKAGSIELGFRDKIDMRVIPDNVKRLIPSSWLCPEDVTYAVFRLI